MNIAVVRFISLFFYDWKGSCYYSGLALPGAGGILNILFSCCMRIDCHFSNVAGSFLKIFFIDFTSFSSCFALFFSIFCISSGAGPIPFMGSLPGCSGRGPLKSGCPPGMPPPKPGPPPGLPPSGGLPGPLLPPGGIFKPSDLSPNTALLYLS